MATQAKHADILLRRQQGRTRKLIQNLKGWMLRAIIDNDNSIRDVRVCDNRFQTLR
jgi:hypothetical protein